MKKLSLTKTLFNSVLFFLKHIILISVFNILAIHCYSGYLIKILNDKLYFYNNQIINSKNILMFLLFLIIFSLKSIIYSTVINDSENGTDSDIGDYFSEILSRFTNVFITIIVSILLTSISSLFVVPGIYMLCVSMFSIALCSCKTENSKNSSNFQKNYNFNNSISRSVEVIKGSILKLITYNVFLLAILVYLMYFTNYDYYVNEWFDSNYFIKFCIFDIYILFMFKIGLFLDKTDEKEYESSNAQEKSKKFEFDKAKSKFDTDRKIQFNGESYIKKKIR